MTHDYFMTLHHLKDLRALCISHQLEVLGARWIERHFTKALFALTLLAAPQCPVRTGLGRAPITLLCCKSSGHVRIALVEVDQSAYNQDLEGQSKIPLCFSQVMECEESSITCHVRCLSLTSALPGCFPGTARAGKAGQKLRLRQLAAVG